MKLKMDYLYLGSMALPNRLMWKEVLVTGFIQAAVHRRNYNVLNRPLKKNAACSILLIRTANNPYWDLGR